MTGLTRVIVAESQRGHAVCDWREEQGDLSTSGVSISFSVASPSYPGKPFVTHPRFYQCTHLLWAYQYADVHFINGDLKYWFNQMFVLMWMWIPREPKKRFFVPSNVKRTTRQICLNCCKRSLTCKQKTPKCHTKTSSMYKLNYTLYHTHHK